MQSWLPYITGSGGALVILAVVAYLLGIGKLHSDREFSKLEDDNTDLRAVNDKLTEALALERQRSDSASQAAAVTNQLIGALTTLATEHRAAEKHEHQDAVNQADGTRALTAPLDLTGKDLGL